jgi:hypothetical protein
MVDWSKRFVRVYADIKQAEGLLLDNCLVWSDDFEAIRSDLAGLMSHYASQGYYAPAPVIKIAQTLISTENDLSI